MMTPTFVDGGATYPDGSCLGEKIDLSRWIKCEAFLGHRGTAAFISTFSSCIHPLSFPHHIQPFFSSSIMQSPFLPLSPSTCRTHSLHNFSFTCFRPQPKYPPFSKALANYPIEIRTFLLLSIITLCFLPGASNNLSSSISSLLSSIFPPGMCYKPAPRTMQGT